MFFFFPFQDHRRFRQRYYEYLDHLRVPDGPIFLMICGEGPCNGIPNDYISVGVSFFIKTTPLIDLISIVSEILYIMNVLFRC